MLRKNDILRYGLVVFCLGAAAIWISIRLVRLHFGLVADVPKPPRYSFERVLPCLRGPIYAAGGRQSFARSVKLWDYHVDPKGVNLKLHSRESVVSNVAEALSLPVDKVREAYWNTHSRYVPLGQSYDDDAHKILSNTKIVSGLAIEERHIRNYPQGRRLSHVIGFISKDPANPAGSAGIELKFDKELKGVPGLVTGERDALGKEIYGRRTISTSPTDGAAVYLTVDQNIQYETERALSEGLAKYEAERAWAVVVAVKTGAVLAMATVPDFDPSMWNKTDEETRKNRAICENYEPGSVMKTITACAAINENIVGPDTLIDTNRNDPNYFRLPADGSHKWEPQMSVRDALVHSSNIVYGKLGVRVTPAKLWEYMRLFGFGQKTRIELPGEEGGLLPHWKSWDKIKWSRAPIGQGVAVTALQLAMAYAAIGNDGVRMRPRIVEKVVSRSGETLYASEPEVVERPITAATARKVRDMMCGVAKKGGTARRAAVKGYTVAGKTGTAQLPGPGGRGYSENDFNASFCGIIPASRPELVILVTYHKPKRDRAHFTHQGGMCAGPTFSAIAERVCRYLEIEPDVPDEIEDEP